MINPEKKKRGRRKKIVALDSSMNNIQIVVDEPKAEQEAEVPTTGKKRGRKPKGGKLILKTQDEICNNNVIPNVILHLKCSLNDLDDYNNRLNKMVTNPLSYNPDLPPDILTYNSNTVGHFSVYDDNYAIEPNTVNDQGVVAYSEAPANLLFQNSISSFENSDPKNLTKEQHTLENSECIHNICSVCRINMDNKVNEAEYEDINNKDITSKIKQLKINLYKNTLQDKKSACFWCTYEYDSPPCYIPKYEMDDKLFGYGSFCRPECAVAYLMKENIDESMKFERYHLLNQIYGKVYEHKKNIKPAPNPYFLLDKFYGNLSIQEYRKLLKSEHMLLVVEKPMTRILPELFEDNEDFILNIYGCNKGLQSNNNSIYKVKRQSEQQQGPSKSSIMRDKFGI
jgi:hypothetical protein